MTSEREAHQSAGKEGLVRVITGETAPNPGRGFRNGGLAICWCGAVEPGAARRLDPNEWLESGWGLDPMNSESQFRVDF